MSRRISQAIWNKIGIAAPLLAALSLIAFLAPELRQQRSQDSYTLSQPSGQVGATRSAQVNPTNFFFVQGELILMGSRPGIAAALQALSGIGVGAEQIREYDLSGLFKLLELGTLPEFFPFSPEEYAQNDLVMRLYKTDDASVLAAVSYINESRNVFDVAGLGEQHVFADPNYLLGVLGQSQCGSPHEPGGSPHEPGGSPFEASSDQSGGGSGEAAASGAGNVPPPEASAEDFWRQWAFEHIGIGLSLADSYGSSIDTPTGQGVLVGVFDTSPFSTTLEAGEGIRGAAPPAPGLVHEPHTVKWENQSLQPEPLALTLSYTDPQRIDRLAQTMPATATRVADHGLFVAGLVHAVAPESQVELIRVLNDYGCGDLQTLNESLSAFIIQTASQRQSPNGVVMNLSLGIHKPRSVDKYALDQIADQMGMKAPDLQLLEKDPLESLLTVLSVADRKKIVVVAAAGNESTQAKALPMHIPADYPFVIGVAASNIERGRACFSNWGDVAAPGGEGGPDSQNEPRPCMPRHAACQGDCPDAVISLALREPGSSPEATYYRYWSGTSFSTPLVSGLAALVLHRSALAGTRATPDQVFAAVRCGASTPDGIINIPDSLFRCLP